MTRLSRRAVGESNSFCHVVPPGHWQLPNSWQTQSWSAVRSVPDLSLKILNYEAGLSLTESIAHYPDHQSSWPPEKLRALVSLINIDIIKTNL